MWISMRSPWSTFSVFPHFTSSQFSPSIQSTRRYHLTQDDHAFNLRLDVPGLHLKNIKVDVKNQTLNIDLGSFQNAEDKTEESPGRWIFNELISHSSVYQFHLPSTVESDTIRAELKNGQLFLTLPKTQPTVKNIEVHTGA